MKSIALKLWLSMITLVVLVLMLLWFFQIVFLEHFYIQMHTNDIKKSGIEIAKLLEQKKEFEFKNKLDYLTHTNNISAQLIDSNYNTLYFSNTNNTNGQMMIFRNNLIKDAYSKTFSGQTISITLNHPKFKNNFMLIGIPIEIDKKINECLYINIPLIPVKDTVNILKIQLLYITIILLFSAIIISFLLSNSFTRPILDIIDVSMAIAKGNFKAKVNLNRNDEIGRLSETINYMGEELSKIEQLRKDLIANISHELRTPLSLIKGYAETIKDVSGNHPQKREKHLDIIIDESNRLSNMVNEILEFSQMQSGYLSLNIQKFKISNILERIYKNFEILCLKSKIEFELKIECDAFIYIDESKIEQVLYNLLNNALTHSNEDCKITLACIDCDDKIRIEVVNTGEGIPEDEIPYIWDRFYKVDKSGDRKKSGTGLGLAIVKSIFTAHNLNYGVKTNNEIGTNFWFEIKKS